MATHKPVKGTSKDSKGLKSQSQPSVFILKVELVDSEPLIWRRIYIDGRARLDAFHHILQAAMGWRDAHLHEFMIREKRYAPPDEEDQSLEIETFDESKFRLNQLLETGEVFEYLYDFGDSWQHRITVESIRELNINESHGGEVWIEAGQRACPPDDAGGIGSYQESLNMLEDKPYSDEAKLMRQWVGLDFDPERFDRIAVNTTLGRMLWNGWIQIGI
jgi:hypothetical protein